MWWQQTSNYLEVLQDFIFEYWGAHSDPTQSIRTC